MTKKNSDKNPVLKGIVTARNCPECGHHEIGLTTQDGTFHTLRPGMKIQIFENLNRKPYSGGDK